MTTNFAMLPVIEPEIADLIPGMLAHLEDGLTGTSPDDITRMIAKLALIYHNGKLNEQDSAVRLELYIDLLGDIPFDCLSQGFRDIAQVQKFFPSVAEIREKALPYLNKRLAKIAALKSLQMKHDREWKPPFNEADRCSPEEAAAILAKFAQRRLVDQ
jgi:hypothetical protein